MDPQTQENIPNQESTNGATESGMPQGNRFRRILSTLHSDPEWVHRSFPVIVLLMLMGLSYIFLTHKHVKALRSIQEYKVENQELRSELIAIQSDLMTQSKQSEIAKRVEALGLKEMRKPPYQIKAKK